MLGIKDVHTYYGDSYILQGISLEVKDSAVVALLGRNGMGKTTTIRTIIGFTPPRRGVINFNDKEIQDLKPHKIARLGIGLVPQGRQIFPSLSVLENLTMAARTTERSGAWNLEKIYDLFPILKTRARFKGTLLSGGEQQMLTIGRALMTNPALLLMDEPSEGLAPIIVQQIGQIIAQLKESGISILLVEQNIFMALELADYVYIISKGVIEYESTPEALRDNEEVKEKYLGVTG
ncbi:MAG: ABC transporter ATP-binding protein [Deltaproteobacteria bacterium]|nr:ABC transporter ATP-binding protein [Deltaproteobacteria bacterium]